MKPLLALLALSLAANAALLIKRPRASAPAPTSPLPPAEASALAKTSPAPVEKSLPSSSGNPLHNPSASSASQATTLADSPHRAFWDKILAGDVSAIDQLRAAGWPPKAIFTLVSTVIQESYQDRFKALRGDATDTRYWTADAFFGNMTATQRKAANALWREQIEHQKKLLGPDFTAFSNAQPWRDQRYAVLPPEKAAAIREIESDYNLLIQDVRADFSMGGPTLMLPEDREKLAFLEKEKRADMARALTPDELLEYDLRASSIASSLRSSLEAFTPSEAEFRTLFRIQQQTAERLGYVQPYGRPSQQDQALAKQMQAEVDAQAKQLLGDQRYADYKRTQDSEYRRLYQLGRRLDLPPAAITAAHDVKTDVEKRIQEAMKSPAAKDRKSLLATTTAIADEGEARMKQALGERAYEVYAANHGYISGLRRSSSPPPATRPAAAAPATK